MTDDLMNARALAEARGESLDAVLSRFEPKVPKVSNRLPALRETRFEEIGVRDGLAYARMPSGRIFYSYLSAPSHRRGYHYVKDVIPSEVTEETYLLALDMAYRYATDAVWPPAAIYPPKDGTVVECGAYLGHKTIRFADELLDDRGRVLAIEMMPDNCEILRRNIRENGLQDRVAVIEAGIWSGPGIRPVIGKGWQRNALVPIAKLTEEIGYDARVDSFDNLLDEWGQPSIDLVFMTINGAEIEALQALERYQEKISSLFVVSRYERGGQKASRLCRDILTAKGFDLLPSSTTDRLLATRRR